MTVQRLITLVVLVAILYGIKHYYDNKRYQERRMEVAKVVNSVFDKAQVTVHGAYPYEGLSYQEISGSNRLVALDVDIKNLTEAPDFDDLDIIDADKGENFGSDPDIIPLDEATGTTYTQKKWPTNLGHIRIMLVYSLPPRVKRVNLGYWAKTLTYTPVAIDENARPVVNPRKSHVLGTHATMKKIEERTGMKAEETVVSP